MYIFVCVSVFVFVLFVYLCINIFVCVLCVVVCLCYICVQVEIRTPANAEYFMRLALGHTYCVLRSGFWIIFMYA